MFLHTNHPHHRAGALRIAGAKAETREALAEAVAKWDGLAIEQAIADGGCVGGLVRSREEWNAHPHGIAVARLPLIDIVQIGEAPPRPLPKGERPLSGVRALDLTRVLAGPTSGRVLAENGADVLHIAAPHLPYQTEILMDTGHGKRCAWVDLTKPAGVETHDEPAARGRRLHPGLSPRHRRRARLLARARGGAQARHRLRQHLRLRPRGPVVRPARLRFDRAERHRPFGHARLARQAAQPAGPGARLHRGLSRRARRHGRAGPPRRARRLVAGARVAGPGRALAGKPRHRRAGQGHGRATRGRTRALSHGKRRPVRPSAASQAGRAAQRDAALLRQAARAARHLAGALGFANAT